LKGKARVISIHLESKKKKRIGKKIVEFKDPITKNGDLWDGLINRIQGLISAHVIIFSF
jgi:hypothetical protein